MTVPYGPDDAWSVSGFADVHQLALTRFAYLLTGDRGHAEDLVQDVLAAMFSRFHDSAPPRNPVAYARAAIVNRHVSRRRLRVSGERAIGLTGLDPAAPESGDPADRDVVWRALARLASRPRAVLVLRFYFDLADAEIADILQCRKGTVSSAAARAYAVLRKDPGFASEFGQDPR